MKAPSKLEHGRRPLTITGSLALAACLSGGLSAVAQDAKTNSAPAQTTVASNADADLEPSPGDYNNWITLGVGGTSVEGDKAGFEHQTHVTSGPFGGVQDFHWQQFVGKTGMFTADGHAMARDDDYSIKLDLSDPDKGYIRGGFSQFRTWYDDNGGFFRLICHLRRLTMNFT